MEADGEQEKPQEDTGTPDGEASSIAASGKLLSTDRQGSTSEKNGLHQSTTVFVFWAYFVAVVSLVTLVFVVVSSILPVDEQTEYFAMPNAVREHLTKGKLLKIELGEDRQPIKVFVREEGPVGGESVVLLHGLGASSFLYRHIAPRLASHGLHVIAIDFPGAGLSEKPVQGRWGFCDKVRGIYEEISEKGLFWRFEQLFETGTLPDYEPQLEPPRLKYRAEDLSDSLAQVLNLLVPSPLHIVLHDTSVETGSAWAIRNPSRVRSITLIDALPGNPSFPVCLLGVPGVGFMMTWSSILQWILLRGCCVTRLTQAEAESHAFLLRKDNGRKATLQTWDRMNLTFDVTATLEGVGQVPVQVIWSGNSGKHWQEFGEKLASDLRAVSYLSHHGGRWPQEDAAPEIADGIHGFISSLPKTEHYSLDEPIPQHIQEMLAQMASGDHDGSHDYGHCSHDHGQGHHRHDDGLGYTGGMGLGGWVL